MSDSPEVMVAYYLERKRERILAMKPGRELDELVAEKVMGTSWHQSSSIANRINRKNTTV